VDRVSNRQLAAGVFRAWGVVWAVYALMTLIRVANLLVHNPYSGEQRSIGTYAVTADAIAFACEVLIFVFLMRKAEWLATVVFPVEAELGTGITGPDLRAVLFSAVGLYFVIDGGQSTVGQLYRLVARSRSGSTAFRMPPETDRLVSAVAETLFGAFVLLRRPGAGGPVRRVRDAYDKTLGLREPSNPD
jgi:hypothetical protein